MENPLNETEVRVMACLFEKDVTTHDIYPLSLNSLTNACNQKSNRYPVVSFEETAVLSALESLRQKRLVIVFHEAGGRVPKYGHAVREKWMPGEKEAALLCELMLRGPQTPGELRIHAGRMQDFTSIEEVEQLLEMLGSGPKIWVKKLSRQPGHKECRYGHLLCGDPETGIADADGFLAEPALPKIKMEADRIASLEKETADLREELLQLKKDFTAFKSQF